MTLEKLQAARVAAMKNGDTFAKNSLSSMIDLCQKAAITAKGRIEITEQLVNETLIKYQKTVQEMIDTCPAERIDLWEKYIAELDIVKQYAPQLLTDPEEIRWIVTDCLNTEGLEPIKANKGKVMKALAPLKGKADMKMVNQIVGEMLV